MTPRSDIEATAPSMWSQASVLDGLAGLAITQPVLDLVGRNPEFFVMARVLHRRAGDLVHLVAGGLPGALFGNVLVRGFGGDGVPRAVLATLAGAALAMFMARARVGQMLPHYRAAANLRFVLAFLFASELRPSDGQDHLVPQHQQPGQPHRARRPRDPPAPCTSRACSPRVTPPRVALWHLESCWQPWPGVSRHRPR